MKVYRLTFALLGLWSCDGVCLGECGGVQIGGVISATVNAVASGDTLVSFCAQSGDSDVRSKIRFAAKPGTVIEEEVLYEGRLDEYEGHNRPKRDTAFWCETATYDQGATRIAQSVHTCLVVADDEPPAKILEIDPRGLISGVKSSGYALKLEVLHPGVLNVRYDRACVAEALGQAAPDGGAFSEPRRELEIL